MFSNSPSAEIDKVAATTWGSNGGVVQGDERRFAQEKALLQASKMTVMVSVLSGGVRCGGDIVEVKESA
jgi:hypothetical protein